MISLDMSLRHMAWADAKLFGALQELPESSLKCTYAAPEWSVAHIAMHLLQGAEWYCYILTGSKWTELREPETSADVAELGAYLQRMYATLIEQCSLPDEMVDFEDEDGINSKPRAMVLAQAVYHSIEHRTQIAIALEINGNRAIDLDTYDLWHFLAQQSS
jgi:uncharacterized damage-inducible protein DinB